METKNQIQDLVKVILNELDNSHLGILDSFRTSSFYKRVDTNLFFTLSAYWLLKDTELEVKNRLLDSSRAQVHNYKNKEGRSSYNFWRTNPYEQFPNSWLFSRISHFWIPDDLDCSALSQLALDSDAFHLLKREALNFRSFKDKNMLGVTIKQGFYSTWFGVKMNSEFDVCVLANYLALSQLILKEITPEDRPSLIGVKSVIENTLWKKAPFETSINYQEPAIIAFHLSRCIAIIPELAALQRGFVEDLQKALEESEEVQNKVMYSLSLKMLGHPSSLKMSTKEIDSFVKKFSFFKASMLSSTTMKTIRYFKKQKLVNVPFICPGFNAAILLKLFTSE